MIMHEPGGEVFQNPVSVNSERTITSVLRRYVLLLYGAIMLLKFDDMFHYDPQSGQ